MQQDQNSANASNGQGASGDKAAQPGQAAAPDQQHINIKVKAQDGTEIFFKIKRTT